MNHSILIEKAAQKALARIPHQYQDRIIQAIMGLGTSPRPSGVRKLSGRNAWRIRIGDYRVIYEINDELSKILVVTLGHRSKIYRTER